MRLKDQPRGSERSPLERDQALQGLRTLARLMDDALAVPGTGLRVGLDALLGLIPGVGDLAGAAVSGYVLLVGARLGAPLPVLLRMLLNIGVDAVVGAVPLLGDLFDLGWKANRRNLVLLERYLERPAETGRASLGMVGVVLALLLLLLAGAGWLVVFLVRLIVT
jgi:hypothetical protein